MIDFERVLQPPEGVQLLSATPSKTGQGGQGVVARYSDGTTASAMLNSDGSLCILLFRGETNVPAVVLPPADDGLLRFSWQARGERV